MICFVGSVFSPYYHWAGRTRPENHCAFNVALYGPGVGRWTMTERGARAMTRNATRFAVGPSELRHEGGGVVLDLDEIAVPIPRRVRGQIRLMPEGFGREAYALDAAGRHRWMPLAPVARVEAAFSHPALRFSGHGYFDTNAGDEPIPAAFRSWDWSRADLKDRTAILYDLVSPEGERRMIATAYDRHGAAEPFTPPPRRALKRTLWGVTRAVQSEADAPRVTQTLEDTPFYARSVLSTRLLAEDAPAVHETLDCGKLDRVSTRLMLPWRMPRVFW